MATRQLQKYDLKACAQLFTQVFSSPPWNEPWNTEAALSRLQHFYDSKDFVGLVAETEDQELLGFVLGNAEPFHFGEMFYLREMCVDTETQGKGIGKALNQALEEELKARNIRSIYLTTDNRIAAAEFYKKQGFRLSETMGFYSKDI